jgi:hypothetical protein
MQRLTTRRFAAWLAIVAMGLNGLWPLLANAAPVEFSAPICSMAGTTVAVDAGGIPVQPAPAKSPAPHCPYCGSSNHHAALTNSAYSLFEASTVIVKPWVVSNGFFPSFVILAAHPRGPPSPLI